MPGLVLRALRWRAALSITVWTCAVVVCAGAALGPVFALAAAESGLQDVLRDAGARTGVRLQGDSGGSPQLTVEEAEQRLDTAAALPPLAHRPDRIGSLFLEARASAGPDLGSMNTRMLWRDGACALVRLDAGRCPDRPGEAIVSSRSAALPYGWKRGATLVVGSALDGASVSVRVVGVYTPRSASSPRWSGQPYFQVGVDSKGVPITDAVLVDRGTFDRLEPLPVAPDAVPAKPLVQEAVDLPLDVRSVRLADIGSLRSQVRALERSGGVDAFTVATSLRAVLAEAEQVRARIDVATALVVLQLCVLGWLVLHRVLVDAVDARSADIALAKLRGFDRTALLRFGLGEPVVLLLLAAPVGALLAVLVATRLADAVLLPGTPVRFTWVALLALVGAVAGGAAAVVQSAWSTLRRPVLEQWRRTRSSSGGSPAGLVADVLVAALAALAFVALRVAGPEAGALTLLGPGLLVCAAGFAGARLLPIVLRPAVPATAASRRIAVFLAVRQVVRRPAGLRLVALLTVAVGLAVFGVGGEVVAAQNRVTRAAAEIGATRVERVRFTPGQDVAGQVARADPDGRWAAAAASWLPFGGDVTDPVLAVDADRLAAVGAAAPGLPSAGRIAAVVHEGAAPSTAVRGRELAVRIRVADRVGGPAPQVVLALRGPDGVEVDVPTSTLRRGAAVYRAAVPCAQGCELIGLSWVGDVLAEGTVSGTALIDRLTVDGKAVATGFSTSGRWRSAIAQGDASDRVRPTAEGLLDLFRIGPGGTGGAVLADLPDPVPALVAGAGARSGRMLDVASPDGAAARLVVAGAAPVLPVVLDAGVVVDLRSFRAALPGFAVDAQWSVWLGPHAPADAVARLRHAGLVIDGEQSLAARNAELARQGPALALLLLAVCAVAGALLAMGGTAVSIAAAVRRRSYEAAALSTVGVRRGQVYRAAILEQLLLLGTAVVVGLPAGVLALVLALPAVPQSADDTPVPLAALPPATPLLLCAAVLVVLVGGTVLLSAGRVVRAGSSSRLREAEE
ncbi:hypothetical protein GCM10025783_15340 [Amnibacterium soli]|uniref:ABC3 transporter permease C-terminal domain-containing protein n=1 Tax=Amnibacterium soli TaxID=1282736 RepID=A0ABP8Z2C8_9MICO